MARDPSVSFDYSEFIYVDAKRLSALISECKLPHTEKGKTLEVTFKFPLPEVKLGQGSTAQELSQNEKIKLLLGHLAKERAIGHGRPNDLNLQKQLRYETCRAEKIFVPPASVESMVPREPNIGLEAELGFHSNANSKDRDKVERDIQSLRRRQAQESRQSAVQLLKDFRGLTIWFSDRTASEPNRLFLVEDYPRVDGEPTGPLSAYSILVALHDEARALFAKTIWHTEEHKFQNPEAHFVRGFGRDAVSELEKMKAQIITGRTITTLYEARRFLPEHDGKVTTMAYPIFIKAGAEL